MVASALSIWEDPVNSVDTMADAVREYGGNGNVLWTKQMDSYFQDDDVDGEHCSLVKLCFRELPEPRLSSLLRVVADNPAVLRNGSDGGPRTLSSSR
jgi:hypothetical protein